MDKLTQRLNEEMNSWIGDLVTNSDLSSEKLLKRYSYEYCIKEEIINYFSENIISDDFEEFLLDKEDTLSYLYVEYMEDDTANIHNEIEGFVSNLYYRLKAISEILHVKIKSHSKPIFHSENKRRK